MFNFFNTHSECTYIFYAHSALITKWWVFKTKRYHLLWKNPWFWDQNFKIRLLFYTGRNSIPHVFRTNMTARTMESGKKHCKRSDYFCGTKNLAWFLLSWFNYGWKLAPTWKELLNFLLGKSTWGGAQTNMPFPLQSKNTRNQFSNR
jgi:hypothetical protein